MNATAPVIDAPRVTGDASFGGLVRIGETLVGALKRLEKRKDYKAVIASDNGQRLLEAINVATRDARNGKGPKVAKPLTADEAPEQAAAEAALVAALEEGVDRGPHLGDVPLELIDIGENVRVDPGELAELAASIAELGVLQPIRVIGPSHDGRYRAVWGQRRVMASVIAKKTTIPALIELDAEANVPGPRRSIEQLAENLQRKDLNPIEEAVALRAVLDADPALTQEALATKLGRSGPWVSNTLRLLGLVQPVQQALRAGTLSQSHGRAIVALPGKDQEEIARRAADEKISSTQLEREIGWKLDAAKQEAAKAAKTEKWIPKAIAALEAAGTPKDVDVSVSGSYYDMDVEAVARAVKKAGWAKAHSGSTYYGGYGSAPEKCDCTSVGLATGGRKAEVMKHCTNPKHVDRARNDDHVAEEARVKAIEAKVADLEARIRPLLESIPLPLLLLIAGRTHDLPELIVGKGDPDRAQLRDLAAGELAGRANSRYVYGERKATSDKALDDLLAMLAPVEGREASIEELIAAGVDVAADDTADR